MLAKNTAIVFILMIVFAACRRQLEPVVCTMEFRTVSIEVIGPTLDSFYTIRMLTGDTIRLQQNQVGTGNTYPVLDDMFLVRLANSQDDFRFCGFLGQQMVVSEVFVIKADACHIYYVSGNTSVIL